MSSNVNAATSGGLTMTSDTSGILKLQTAGTDAVTIDASQNVGIGTSSPAYRLDVASASGIASQITSGTGGVAALFKNLSSGTSTVEFAGTTTTNNVRIGAFGDVFTLNTGGSERMRIDSSGYLLVGATSSSGVGTNRFQLGGSSTTTQSLLKTTTGHSAEYVTGTAVYKSWVSGGFLALGEGPANGATFTERMRIDSSGNLLVGTTTAGAKFTVERSTAGNWTYFKSPNTSETSEMWFGTESGDTPNVMYQAFNNSTGNIAYYMRFGGTTSTYNNFLFDNSGNASKSSGAGSWLALSDERVKTNFQPITNGLSRIIQLKPTQYDYKQPSAHHGKVTESGFIAQEFAEVYPQSVIETDFVPDADKQYIPEGEKAKAMAFNSEFYADLVSAIQEQQALITSLTERITALEGAAQ